jgi:hypothetical protein
LSHENGFFEYVLAPIVQLYCAFWVISFITMLAGWFNSGPAADRCFRWGRGVWSALMLVALTYLISGAW